MKNYVETVGKSYFAGGKEGPEKILSQKIRVACCDHSSSVCCLHCGQPIKRGMLYEAMFAIWDGPVQFKWCGACLFALFVEEFDGCELSMARDGLFRGAN